VSCPWQGGAADVVAVRAETESRICHGAVVRQEHARIHAQVVLAVQISRCSSVSRTARTTAAPTPSRSSICLTSNGSAYVCNLVRSTNEWRRSGGGPLQAVCGRQEPDAAVARQPQDQLCGHHLARCLLFDLRRADPSRMIMRRAPHCTQGSARVWVYVWYVDLCCRQCTQPDVCAAPTQKKGKGVYFADMVSKSANYCFTSPQNNIGFLLLCEVALGDMNELSVVTRALALSSVIMARCFVLCGVVQGRCRVHGRGPGGLP